MIKDLVKSLRSLCHGRDLWSVWCDFLELAALCMANSLATKDAQWKEREGRYLAVAKQYSGEEMATMSNMLGMLVCALDVDRPEDVLGQAYMELELGNKWAGQFFTPSAVCDVMAAMIVDDELKQRVASRGFVTVSEPAVGGGAMVIGLYNAFRAAGLDPHRHMHVTAVDVDRKAVHMAYVQFSILQIPAAVVVGDTLRLEEKEVFYTPAHVIGGWATRLRFRDVAESATVMLEQAPEVSESVEAVPEASDASDSRGDWEQDRQQRQMSLFG